MLPVHPTGAPIAEPTKEHAATAEHYLRLRWSETAPALLLGEDFKQSIQQWISDETSLLMHAPSIDGNSRVLVGGATYRLVNGVLFLILLAIRSGFRGKGHGTALLAELHEIAGTRPIVMLADEHPPKGQTQSSSKFYRQKLGPRGVRRVEKSGTDVIKRIRMLQQQEDVYRIDEIHGESSCGAVALQFEVERS